MIKTSDRVFSKNIPLTLFERFVCERELETEQNCNILTPTLLAITAFLLRSPGLLNWKPGGQASLGHVLIPASSPKWSVHQLVWSPTATAQSGAWGPTLLGAGFLYRILSPTDLVSKLTDFLSSPSYMIVPRQPSFRRHNRTHSARPRSRLYSDIPWADAPIIYISAFPILIAWPGRRSIYNRCSSVQHLVRLNLDPTLESPALLYIQHAVFHIF